jgi:dihydrofolate reductase
MRNIVYYVALSLDGFIAAPGDVIDDFVGAGNGLTQYLEDLKGFDTVIMGRRTYEFGYKYGLAPGQPAYPHMRHYIFSRTLHLDNPHNNVQVCPPDIDIIQSLKEESGTDIYLCGGGDFAGWLLEHGQIDILKIKLNPLVLGEGIPLFGKSARKVKTELVESRVYENGLQIMTYHIRY